MAESLDSGLELIISVEVGWVACWMEVVLELRLEAVDDQSALEASVGGEHLSGVDLSELEGPLGDHDDFGFEVHHID